jgi:uncharacterized membrane protein
MASVALHLGLLLLAIGIAGTAAQTSVSWAGCGTAYPVSSAAFWSHCERAPLIILQQLLQMFWDVRFVSWQWQLHVPEPRLP